jgi:hypothetical protein
MANRFTVNPLGGFNVGAAVGGAIDQYQQKQAMEEEQLQQKNFQGLLKRAYETGNQKDIAEVFSMNPQVGQMLAKREAEKAQRIGAENLARAKEAEVDWGIRWKQAATPEQKEALKQEALANPLIDIDESDLGVSGQQADLGVDAMLFGHLGKDQFKALGLQTDPYKEQDVALKREANDIRRLENQERSLDRQVKRETNELKRQELEAKLASNREASAQKKRDLKAQADNAVATFDNSLNTIDRILESEGFSSAVGARLPIIDSLPGSDAQETIGLIETLQSQNFLNQIEKMKGLGSLSNAEGEKVSAAIGSLNRDMSESAFKRSLNEIKRFITKGRNAALEQYGRPVEQEVQTQDLSDLSDEDLLKKYGGV